MAETPREVQVTVNVSWLIDTLDKLLDRIETLEARSEGIPYGEYFDKPNEERISSLEEEVFGLRREVSDLRVGVEDR